MNTSAVALGAYDQLAERARALYAALGGRHVDELCRRQPVLGAAALVFAAAMLPTLLAMQFDPRTVNGVNGWVKPTKFLLSLAVYYATLAWYFGYLPRAAQFTRGGRFVIYGSVAVGVVEMLWLLLAAAQGVPAHFNATSVAWQIAYSSAGAGATLLLVAMYMQSRMLAREALPGVSPTVRAGIVYGAHVAFWATLITAFVLASGTGHWVGGEHSDAQGLPLLGWSRSGGDLRIAHFWALHAQQLVPLLAWLLGEKLGVLRSPRGVALVAALYLGFVVVTFVQALLGQPFIPL